MDIKRPNSLDFDCNSVNLPPIVGADRYNLDSDDSVLPEMLQDSKEHPPTDFFESTPSARDGLAKTGVSGVIVLPNFEH